MIGRSTSTCAGALMSTQIFIGALASRRARRPQTARRRAGSGPSGRRCGSSRSRPSADLEVVGPRAAAITSAISRMSSSTMPRVVSAGVPIRRPEGFIGGRSSKGIALRLTVIPTSSSRSSAVWPSRPVGVEVDEDEVDVGAAGEHRDAARFEPGGERLGVGDRLPLACAELLAGGDPQGDRLGGDRVHQRPALLAGEDRFVDRLARAPRGRGSCRCAGRRASCGSSS